MRGKPRILLVDVSRSSSHLPAFLRDYDICETEDGRSALREISQHPPDLIILDTLTPGIDEKSMLGILKNNSKTKHIPIIYISDAKDSKRSLDLLAKGADEIITRQCNPDLLRSRVTYLLKAKNTYEQLSNVPHTLSIIAQQVESRVPFLKAHSTKVATYAGLLGQQLLFTSQDLRMIRIAASLILIGYTCIADDLLKKFSFYTPPDWDAIQRHTITAKEICSNFSQLENVGTWLSHHHERYDGSGYPAGLSGTSISLAGRCLAIAEAYTALTSDRPYRTAYSHEEALTLLNEGAGSQWDPELVASFTVALTKHLNKSRMQSRM